jgi:hypothetical protein
MYREVKINWEGEPLILRIVNLFGKEKENKLFLLYRQDKLIAKIHEIWDLDKNYYSLKIRCLKEEEKLMWEYTGFLPLIYDWPLHFLSYKPKN